MTAAAARDQRGRFTTRNGDPVEPLWRGLNGSQADGHECVMCETSFLIPEVPAQHRPTSRPGARTGPAGVPSVPVGVSETGSQVFACLGICAALAIPD